MRNAEHPLLHTVPEAAERLRVSESSIWRLLRLGKLCATSVLGRTMISEAELLRFVAEATRARADRRNCPLNARKCRRCASSDGATKDQERKSSK